MCTSITPALTVSCCGQGAADPLHHPVLYKLYSKSRQGNISYNDIFLSYDSGDRTRASQLAVALGKQGWEVWWDRTILPGKTFDRVIESELKAATCVIVLWSKTSVESRWVRAEASDALDKGRLIPVLLEDLEIPLVFRQIQAASLLDWSGDTEDAGFIQLTRAITVFVSPTLTSDTSTDVGIPQASLKRLHRNHRIVSWAHSVNPVIPWGNRRTGAGSAPCSGRLLPSAPCSSPACQSIYTGKNRP